MVDHRSLRKPSGPVHNHENILSPRADDRIRVGRDHSKFYGEDFHAKVADKLGESVRVSHFGDYDSCGALLGEGPEFVGVLSVNWDQGFWSYLIDYHV
jgi:hypothetical protein